MASEQTSDAAANDVARAARRLASGDLTTTPTAADEPPPSPFLGVRAQQAREDVAAMMDGVHGYVFDWLVSQGRIPATQQHQALYLQITESDAEEMSTASLKAVTEYTMNSENVNVSGTQEEDRDSTSAVGFESEGDEEPEEGCTEHRCVLIDVITKSGRKSRQCQASLDKAAMNAHYDADPHANDAEYDPDDDEEDSAGSDSSTDLEVSDDATTREVHDELITELAIEVDEYNIRAQARGDGVEAYNHGAEDMNGVEAEAEADSDAEDKDLDGGEAEAELDAFLGSFEDVIDE